MRCFIGIELSKNVRLKIDKFMDEARDIGAFYGKYVEPENLHISLKFLGEVDTKKVGELKDVLNTIKFKPFTASLEGIGAFPSEHYVKVLWIAVNKGNKEIRELHNLIDEKLEANFHKDKNFIPHITLLRVKNVSDKNKVTSFFKKNEGINLGEIDVRSFCLYKSTLTSDGPVYEKIKEFKLL